MLDRLQRKILRRSKHLAEHIDGLEVDKAENCGDTPLSNAMENGHEKCAALLRAAGAKDVR